MSSDRSCCFVTPRSIFLALPASLCVRPQRVFVESKSSLRPRGQTRVGLLMSIGAAAAVDAAVAASASAVAAAALLRESDRAAAAAAKQKFRMKMSAWLRQHNVVVALVCWAWNCWRLSLCICLTGCWVWKRSRQLGAARHMVRTCRLTVGPLKTRMNMTISQPWPLFVKWRKRIDSLSETTNSFSFIWTTSATTLILTDPGSEA